MTKELYYYYYFYTLIFMGEILNASEIVYRMCMSFDTSVSNK